MSERVEGLKGEEESSGRGSERQSYSHPAYLCALRRTLRPSQNPNSPGAVGGSAALHHALCPEFSSQV